MLIALHWPQKFFLSLDNWGNLTHFWLPSRYSAIAAGQAQGSRQATGQRASAAGASTALPEHKEGQGAAPSLMGVLKDAAVTAPSFHPLEVEEDDYDAE